MGRGGADLRDASDLPSLELARAAFEVAIAEKPAGRFMIRSRTRVVQGTWRAIGEQSHWTKGQVAVSQKDNIH
jgi:hypothetical protein